MRYYTRIVKRFARGDVIFSEHSPCDGMYIIDTGKVRVYKTVEADDRAKEIELCTLGPKAMFGEMGMIDNSPRSASVQAIEPTTCTLITKKIFEDQLSRIPVWMVNMIKILVQRLRETNNKMRTIIEQYTTAPEPDMGGLLTVRENEIPELQNAGDDEGRSRDSEKKTARSKSGSYVDTGKNADKLFEK